MSKRRKTSVDLKAKGGIYVAGGGQEIEIGISRVEYKELLKLGAIYDFEDDDSLLMCDNVSVQFVVD